MGRDSGGGEVRGEEGGGGGRGEGGGSRLARLLVLEKESEEREERKLKKREEGMFQRLGARLRGSFRKLRTEMVRRRGEEEEEKKKRRRGKSEEEGSELCESEIQPSGRDSAYFSLNMSLSEEEEEEEDGSCLDVREGSVSPGEVGRCSDILVRQIREPARDPRAIGTLPYGCTRDLPFGLHLQGPHPVRCIINTFLRLHFISPLVRFESVKCGPKPHFELGHQVAALQVFFLHENTLLDFEVE